MPHGRSVRHLEKSMMGFQNWLQHKPLLLFYLKKVIVAKVKLCGKLLHKKPPCFVTADIIPQPVE